MRYYITTIVTTTAGAEARDTNWSFSNLNDATKRFHLLMGANMNESKVATCLMILFNENGSIIRLEKYVADVKTEGLSV